MDRRRMIDALAMQSKCHSLICLNTSVSAQVFSRTNRKQALTISAHFVITPNTTRNTNQEQYGFISFR